jgi:mannose-6-phosphate isomerase
MHAASRFPILLKVLDCEDVLSLQVHPPAAIATALGGEPKTEMWYVADAEPGAMLYAGLKQGATREKFVQALADGSVADLVHHVYPERGQFMFVESGRLHALGAGLLVFEIQQNSDTTYRVFDWNRMGLDGRPRELHVQESLACIDFSDFEPPLQSPTEDGALASCPWFDVRLSHLDAGKQTELSHPEDFVCIAMIRGSAAVLGIEAETGAFLLVPPAVDSRLREIVATSDAEWLEIRLP